MARHLSSLRSCFLVLLVQQGFICVNCMVGTKMHTIYTKIAAKLKIRILTNWDQKVFLVKISTTDLIQELPSKIDRSKL
jgi:hypothetical protein